MLQGFETWSQSRAETNSFSDLDGATIGIDASFYLNRLLTQPPSKEPLVSALGGVPFSLEANVKNELQILSNHNITPLFIFNGLEIAKKYRPFKASDDAAARNAEGWRLYHEHQAEKAVEAFGNSGFAKAEDFYRFLQAILHENKVDFQVAPYTAWGQLAYLAGIDNEYVDAIAGSSELLLFNVDKVITHIDFERGQFTFITRQACLQGLGLPSTDMLVDACMLSGSELLPPLPTLNSANNRRNPPIRTAVELLKSHGNTGLSVCTQFQEEPAMQNAEYLDRYRKSRLAVKHQVVLTSAGNVEPLMAAHIPNDLHEVVGQRLPEELYFYFSRAIIGSRTLNQLTSQQILESTPADGGDAEEYRTLVRERLTPLRIAALSLLSKPLTRAYSHRDIRLRCWFDPSRDITISYNDYIQTEPITDKWNVHEEVLRSGASIDPKNVSLSSVLRSMSETSFASQTISPRDPDKLLSTRSEIVFNSMGRFYHLHGYLNDKHELTNWGKVLNAMIQSSPTSEQFDEAAVLGSEMLRLNLLNADNMFQMYSGHPFRGSDTDKRNCLLISRIACFGRLRHKSIGFTGPLSRSLLGYSAMINAVRKSLRDLLEICLVTMLLHGDVDRDTDVDLTDVSLKFPFLLPSDCSLGIAMKQYLDELSTSSERSDSAKEEILKRGPTEWFPYSEDFKEDLQKAFTIWDKIYAGVKVAAELGLVKEKELWDGADAWLASRR